MGYQTEFTGSVTVEPPLAAAQVAHLREFSEERHDDWDIPNIPRSVWCDWVATDDGTAIKWNGTEKFYDGDQWMRYLIDTFIQPAGHVVNGVIEAQGEDPDDRWDLVVTHNEVTVRDYKTVPVDADPLAYLPPNLDGCDWAWEDHLGHSVQVSESGQILTGDDEWVFLSPQQWGELARVAVYMRDREIDPIESRD
jgi:hypothetical protein